MQVVAQNEQSQGDSELRMGLVQGREGLIVWDSCRHDFGVLCDVLY